MVHGLLTEENRLICCDDGFCTNDEVGGRERTSRSDGNIFAYAGLMIDGERIDGC